MPILGAYSHHLAQPILLAGRPFINLTVSDWLPDQTQFASCQLEICLQLYMPAWKRFEDIISNFEAAEASNTDENTI